LCPEAVREKRLVVFAGQTAFFGKCRICQFISPYDKGEELCSGISENARRVKRFTGKGMNKMAELTKTVDQAIKAMTDKEGKYLTFALAGEEYGIGILKVKEIIGMMPVTAVPRTPGYVKGVINLRGKVIPVVDLRMKFGMEEKSYTDRTSIVVVEFNGETGRILIGIVVDSVSEVLNIRGGDIEETPTIGAKLDTDYILGMAKIGAGIKILLDINKVLRTGEFDNFEQVA